MRTSCQSMSPHGQSLHKSMSIHCGGDVEEISLFQPNMISTNTSQYCVDIYLFLISTQYNFNKTIQNQYFTHRIYRIQSEFSIKTIMSIVASLSESYTAYNFPEAANSSQNADNPTPSRASHNYPH